VSDGVEGVSIRLAEAKDAPILYEMIRELAADQDELDYIFATPESFARDGFGAEPLFAALLAEVAGTPAGYVTYTTPYNIWAGRRLLVVDDLYVRVAFRSRGIGESLMRRVGDIAAVSRSQVRWMVKADNRRAIAFYESLGATIVLRGICYWRPGG
jgi:ribosomal protein S18 acetylase RimI-like enzyme